MLTCSLFSLHGGRPSKIWMKLWAFKADRSGILPDNLADSRLGPQQRPKLCRPLRTQYRSRVLAWRVHMKPRMLMAETKKWWFSDMGSRLIWGECGGGWGERLPSVPVYYKTEMSWRWNSNSRSLWPSPPFEKQNFVMAVSLTLVFLLLNFWTFLDPWSLKRLCFCDVLIRDDHDRDWSSRDLPCPMSHEAC